MSCPRPVLALLASITILLAVLSTAIAVNEEAAGTFHLVDGTGAVTAEPIGHLLVSEVMTGGASASDELIELYNPSASALPLEGLEVIYVTATGGTITRKASWAAGASMLPAGAHVLIANAAGVFAGVADVTYTNGLAAAGGSVAVRIVGASTAIDAVGWGTAASTWMEGSAALAAAAGHSIERLPGGGAGSGQDTDQNGTDFVERTSPDPQNTASAPIVVPTPQPTPSPTAALATLPPSPMVTPSATEEPTATPTASEEPTAKPTAPLTPTPSPTVSPVMPSPTPSAQPTSSPSPMPAPMTIADARAMPDGTAVTVEGVSLTDSAFSEGGGYLADATGGIAVLLSEGSFPRATTLRVQGALDQRFSQRTIRATGADVMIIGSGTEPSVIVVATGAIGEAQEGELVELDGIVVSGQTTLTSGIAVDLDDGSGPIRVMVGLGTGIDTATWTRDVRLHLRGVVGQRDSSGSGTTGYRVQPRDVADVLAVTPPATPSPAPSVVPSATPEPSADPSVLSIAAARATAVNTRLTVRGVVTLPSGLVEAGTATIQDSSGAILLRLGDEAGSLRLGELVEVAGTRSTKSGMETLRVTTTARRLGSQAQPTPLRRATGALGEAQEAMVVLTSGEVTLTPRRTSADTVYFDIDDGSGPIRIFVSPRAGIETDTILSGSVVEVKGVLGQETTGKLPDRGYRLWPRTPADLRMLAAAPGASAAGATGSGSVGQSGGSSGSETGGVPADDGQPATAPVPKPARQQHLPRLEAPVPTDAIPSAIPNTPEPGQALMEKRDANPAPAAAGLLALAALLLGGGGVAAGPPSLAGRLRASLRAGHGGTPGADGNDRQPLSTAFGDPPRLVPLSVIEDAHERAGRILPPT